MGSLAAFFILLDAHVILAAPTHAAGDVFFDKLHRALQKVGMEEEPLRAYGGISEMEGLFKENRDIRHASNARETARTEEVLDETIPTMFFLANTLKRRTSDNKRALASLLVEAKAVEIANDNKTTIMARYPSPPRKVKRVLFSIVRVDKKLSKKWMSPPTMKTVPSIYNSHLYIYIQVAPTNDRDMVSELDKYLDLMATKDPKT